MDFTQVNPSGTLIVPTTSKAEYIDYYEKTPSDMIKVSDKYTSIDVTGDLRYKVGFKACQLTPPCTYG